LSHNKNCVTPKEIVPSDNLSSRCNCEGKGNNTIVIDAGMGNWSLFNQPLYSALKDNYKVCLIDRPGYAMDSVTLSPRDLETVATEMNQALESAGIQEPIILIGHSLGGLHVRKYQSLFPDQVVGLVLLESAHPKQLEKLPTPFRDLLNNQPQQLDDVISLAKKGYLKYGKSNIPTFGLPETLLEEYYGVTTEPEYYFTMKAEASAFANNLKHAASLPRLDSLPLLVIGSKNSMDESILPSEEKEYPYQDHNEIWFEMQKDLAHLSANSTFLSSDKNHYLNVTDVELIYPAINDWIEKEVRHEN